jgi:hypothetical protein
MKQYFKFMLLAASLTNITVVYSQIREVDANRFSPKEFTIPAAPVFDMMGVTPSQINRASDIKDFKVDWSFKSWKLNPNIAIQAQPFWEILYSGRDLSKYQSASTFMKKLSALDVSIGTVQDETNDRRLGFAIKMNIYKQKDPLMAKDIYAGISEKYAKEKKLLEEQLKTLQLKLDTTNNILDKPIIRMQINATEQQIFSEPNRRRDEINQRAKIFINENWNSASIDIAFGKIYSYKTDSAGTLSSLRLNRNTGFGAWINGSFGIGKSLLISGLARATLYEEQLDFLLKDINNNTTSTETAVAKNKIYSVGANIRYGSPLFNFFVEFLYETKQIKTASEALNKAFTPESTNLQIVESSVKWTGLTPNNITVGGEWRMSRSVILNYGMRCIFDKDWKFNTFIPVATLSCLMR